MTSLVDFAAMKQPVDFANAFDEIMGNKIVQRIDAMRQEIATKMYASEEDVEDVEDDDDDLDLENLDVDEFLGDEDEEA